MSHSIEAQMRTVLAAHVHVLHLLSNLQRAAAMRFACPAKRSFLDQKEKTEIIEQLEVLVRNQT